VGLVAAIAAIAAAAVVCLVALAFAEYAAVRDLIGPAWGAAAVSATVAVIALILAFIITRKARPKPVKGDADNLTAKLIDLARERPLVAVAMRTGRWWPRELPGVFIRLAGVAVCGGDDGHIRGAVSRAVGVDQQPHDGGRLDGGCGVNVVSRPDPAYPLNIGSLRRLPGQDVVGEGLGSAQSGPSRPWRPGPSWTATRPTG